MTVTMIAIAVMYGLVLLRTRKDSSILTSGIASLYCLYLQWTALSSDQNPTCNKNLGSASNSILQILGGLAFTCACLIVVSSTPEEPAQASNEPLMDGKKAEEKKESKK
jgi:hypothetical protein